MALTIKQRKELEELEKRHYEFDSKLAMEIDSVLRLSELLCLEEDEEEEFLISSEEYKNIFISTIVNNSDSTENMAQLEYKLHKEEYPDANAKSFPIAEAKEYISYWESRSLIKKDTE